MSEVVRAGMRRLMEDDGATEFYRLREDIRKAMAEPSEEVDVRELLLGGRDDIGPSKAS